MTPDELDRLEALANAATTEPDRCDMPFAPGHEGAAAWWYVVDVTGDRTAAFAYEEDAELFHAAVGALPRLIAEVRRLREERAAMKALLAESLEALTDDAWGYTVLRERIAVALGKEVPDVG